MLKNVQIGIQITLIAVYLNIHTQQNIATIYPAVNLISLGVNCEYSNTQQAGLFQHQFAHFSTFDADPCSIPSLIMPLKGPEEHNINFKK